ncbi:hypothetical protein HanPI659440_Chr16g0635061 [Helianthus annuus]|nr:hypothetical protein HanPI659440_Chr16g0635061 [Helianthus annuus]
MADIPGYLITCLNSGKLALLAILVSGGIVLQILACVLYNNWWPMLTGTRRTLILAYEYPVVDNSNYYITSPIIFQ